MGVDTAFESGYSSNVVLRWKGSLVHGASRIEELCSVRASRVLGSTESCGTSVFCYGWWCAPL